MARLSCMKLNLPPFSPHIMSKLGLAWDGRDIIRVCDKGVLLQGYHYSFEKALYLAASDNLADMFFFLKRVMVEYTDATCSKVLVFAAEDGNIRAVQLCWEMGICVEAYRAMVRAATNGHVDVIEYFLKVGAADKSFPSSYEYVNEGGDVVATAYPHSCHMEDVAFAAMRGGHSNIVSLCKPWTNTERLLNYAAMFGDVKTMAMLME